MYYEGIATKNYKKAVFWLKISAKANYVDAFRDLGYCYYMGVGVRKNFKKAVFYYLKAAKRNDIKAQWNLGQCYLYGEGIIQSNRWSSYWISIAAKQGHSEAIKFLKSIGTY